MGSLQNPFFTAFVEESLTIDKRPVKTGLFLFSSSYLISGGKSDEQNLQTWRLLGVLGLSLRLHLPIK